MSLWKTNVSSFVIILCLTMLVPLGKEPTASHVAINKLERGSDIGEATLISLVALARRLGSVV